MKIGLRVMGIALVLSGCGARIDDNHTGGKTSWLSACSNDAECGDLDDAVCASKVCTTECQSGCAIGGTACMNLWASLDVAGETTRVCLPECERDGDCSKYGSNFTCQINVCLHDTAGLTGSEGVPYSPVDAGGKAGDSLLIIIPTRDIPGVVLLDNADDGNNEPLEDLDSPVGFSSYGFWFTYDDTQSCTGNGVQNLDEIASLEPPQGAMLETMPYSALGLAPPPEVLANAPDNTHGIRITGTGHDYFGAGLGFKFEDAYAEGNPGVDLRAAGYTGIRFWAYSPLVTDFIVKLQDAYSTPDVGLCVPRGSFPACEGPESCGNAPSTVITAGPLWLLYELYFATVADDLTTSSIEQGPLMRAIWDGVDVEGNPIKDIPPTPNRIYRLEFQTALPEGDDNFDLVIDNVGFIVANGPEDNAKGQFTPQ